MFGQKNAFWKALVVTVLIFSFGIYFGFILESWRSDKINFLFQESEISLLDIKLQGDIYSQGDFNCEKAIEENFKFADRIYEEAKLLGRFEKASRLSEELTLYHKKYDILRANLLLNSIKIKEECDQKYYEIVYFYKFEPQDMNLKAKQNIFSKFLSELKEQKGEDILLIPIAGDINISSVNLLLDRYDILQEDLPIILINREIKIRDIENIEDLKKYLE